MPLDATTKACLADRIGLTPLSETAVLTHKAMMEQNWRDDVASGRSPHRPANWLQVGNRHFSDGALSPEAFTTVLNWIARWVGTGRIGAHADQGIGRAMIARASRSEADHSTLNAVSTLAMETAERLRREGVEPALHVEVFDTDPILYIGEMDIHRAIAKDAVPIAIWDYEANGKAKIVALARLD